MELWEDQIHAPAFQKICDYLWSDRLDESYALSVVHNIAPHLKIVNSTNLPAQGVIFIGMCHVIERVLESMPQTGSYILVHRTNDRSFTPAMYACKPASVRHIYSVDCQVVAEDVTAIPFGNNSINGEDNIIKEVAVTPVSPAATKVFCRYNVNRDTLHRNESLPVLKTKPFVKVLEEQIPADDFYREIKAHRFTMALAGCGQDASRQWAAIQLGSIPIVTDCIEMRHFADLPLVYCPGNIHDLTEDWLDAQSIEGKSTERMRMSYWQAHLRANRIRYGLA